MLILLFRTGGNGDGDDEEMTGLVDEGEEDGDSEDGDQVTETEVAQSEPGRQPVFHHEIYNRLVNLMSRQGAYSNTSHNHPPSRETLTSL